jgi:hypothetical protein
MTSIFFGRPRLPCKGQASAGRLTGYGVYPAEWREARLSYHMLAQKCIALLSQFFEAIKEASPQKNQALRIPGAQGILKACLFLLF